MTAEPNFAKKVVVDSSQGGLRTSITVDGQEFPWLLSDEGLTIKFTPGGGPVVIMLPLLVESAHLITANDDVVYGKDIDL